MTVLCGNTQAGQSWGFTMSSPQKENGYTPIANELLDALCRLHLSGSEWSYLHALIRKTYGFNKKEDWVTNSQICILTGMRKERVSEAKRSLINKNIVTEKRNKVSIQKDYDKWRELRKSVTKVTEKRNSELRISVHTKDTITKDNNSETKVSQKKTIMGWQAKNSDNDDDLPAIDLDSGEAEKKLEKVRSQASVVFELFKEILGTYPLNWRVNKTIRTAAENLMKERGESKIKHALLFYRENKDREYCPTILTPYDLDSKWTKLAKFKSDNGL